MKNRIGTFYTNCKVENHVDRKKSVEIPKLPVDTGSGSHLVFLADTLKKAGITKRKKNYTFIMAMGDQITGPIGFRRHPCRRGLVQSSDQVCICATGGFGIARRGAEARQGLNLRVDSRRPPFRGRRADLAA